MRAPEVGEALVNAHARATTNALSGLNRFLRILGLEISKGNKELLVITEDEEDEEEEEKEEGVGGKGTEEQDGQGMRRMAL